MRLGADEVVGEERFNGGRVIDDFGVALLRLEFFWRSLQPIERALAGQRMPPITPAHAQGAGEVRLAHRQRQQRIVAQHVMVVEILIPLSQGQHALRNQFLDLMFDQSGVAVVTEASGKAL
jgi:hypothetical protein